MMGVKDYVMGLEPGNCTPDGRNVMRENGTLKFLAPGETKTYSVSVTLVEKRGAVVCAEAALSIQAKETTQ